jgi:outer membrane protein OmpA-like peptidoglycan-associated protein
MNTPMLVAACLVFVGLIAGTAIAQPVPNPTRAAVATPTPDAPVFRVVVVGRSIEAINFRPRGGETTIDFVGTGLSPRAHGDATIEGKDGVIEIDADFDDLPQARARTERDQQERALRERLRQQLDDVLETRETTRGLIVNVPDVLFNLDSAGLNPGAREKLARVAGILLAQPGLEVSIEGYTDNIGTHSYNEDLSKRRADAVRDYLVGQGIQPRAVATAGFGETQPVATNETAAGRQQNRRVELVVSGETIGTSRSR